APHGALASAPSAGRVGEAPVASDRLNVSRRRQPINIPGLTRALFSSAAPDLGRAPAHAGRHGNRSVVRDFAAPARIFRSSPAGHKNGRKKCSVVITLAASVTASGSGVFRL